VALGISDFDLTTGVHNWDARARELFGIGPDVPMTEELYYSRIHPDDRARVRATLAAGLRPDAGGVVVEMRVVTEKGERWVQAATRVSFVDGRPVSLVGTALDITERKRATEAALRESETWHRLLFEGSRDAIMTLEPPEWRFTSANRATVEMFGAKSVAEFTAVGPWVVISGAAAKRESLGRRGAHAHRNGDARRFALLQLDAQAARRHGFPTLPCC
jgi:PAS domain S-box-containing protein